MASIKEVERNARQLVKDAAGESGEVYEGDDGDWVKSVYIGSVISLSPSGKIYTPFANSNVDLCLRCKGSGCDFCGGLGSREAYLDQCWQEAMEAEANKKGGWIESGEGSADDLFLVCPTEEKK